MDMNRRGFLRMLGGAAGGGIVASATMAEVGMLAEFMSWLKRKPAWSFPSANTALACSDINAATMQYIVPVLPDSAFKASPIFLKLRQAGMTTLAAAALERKGFAVGMVG